LVKFWFGDFRFSVLEKGGYNKQTMLSQDFWKRYFKVYDCLNLLIPYQELIKTIIDNLDIKRGDLVLDLGSGTGNIAVEVEKLGAKVVGIDSSAEGVKIHKMKLPSSQVMVGDITQRLPFDDNYFDKIYSNNVVYTIPESKRGFLFSELHRVLKPGGIIVVSNVKEGFKPIAIYINHLKKQIKRDGLLSTFFKVIKLIIPTFKMFYYNFKIKRENKSGAYKFMKDDSQRKYLTDAGFKEISDNISVYAGQGVLTFAIKNV
jgi:ubiquinone/menaquinone biosynthesis C-methylase UbiE